jgi:hypothetical protein
MLINSPSGSADIRTQDAYVDPPRIFAEDKEQLTEAESNVKPPLDKAPQKTSWFDSIANIYRTVSWILGFNEKYSLAFRACYMDDAFPITHSVLLVIFFGGALIGFCLARSMMMSPANVRDKTVPGMYQPSSIALRREIIH